MKTKTKTFDAVIESRKWREESSRKLNAMSAEEQVAYLQAVKERYTAEWNARAEAERRAKSSA